MKKIIKFFSGNRLLIGILILGAFLRIYKPLSLFSYGHDQDLAGWIVKDITSGHLRLIGQQTSSLGIFIGPLFYYLQIPFYFLTGMDPLGTILLPFIISVFTIFSIFFVFGKIWKKEIGLIGAFIYAVSAVVVFTDREAVPTMPVHLWSVWFFYALWLIRMGRQKAYILIGILFGLVWHLNLALAVVVPLVIFAQVISKTKINLKYVGVGLTVFVLLMLPFALFETRHGFLQTKAIAESFTSEKDYVPGTGRGLAKLDRVVQLVEKNTQNIFWGTRIPIRGDIIFYSLIITFLLLLRKNTLDKTTGLTMFLWLTLFIVFFTSNSINVSEYYLNGMNIIWIAIASLGIGQLFKKKKYILVFLILAVIGILNLWEVVKKVPTGQGYLERKAIVGYIKSDAEKMGYPCVSVSYITTPGNDLGYRYLYWLQGMHVNQPASGSPVYSIVFPVNKVSRVDANFGSLGLVLPDYDRYTKDEIGKSCGGANSNLTDPMFGYTE